MVTPAAYPEPLGPSQVLTQRELQVLELTSLGMTNAKTAERLGVTVHAIKFHLAAIYRKLGVTNRTEAVVRLLGETTEPRRSV